MGITYIALELMGYYKNSYGIDFSDTATLGRQQLFVSDKQLYESNFNFTSKQVKQILSCDGYSDYLWESIGAKKIDSFDYSGYEGASHLHDMNKPLPKQYLNQYSLVYDGGTLEHIFNFPIGIKNVMDMVRVGGHLIIDTPTNNYCGHGFYQFSPELFYNALSDINGYKILSMAYYVTNEGRNMGIKKLVSPNELNARIEIYSKKPTSLSIVAKKVGMTSSEIHLLQSDYKEHVWINSQRNTVYQDFQQKHKVLEKVRKKVPFYIRGKLSKIARKRILEKNYTYIKLK